MKNPFNVDVSSVPSPADIINAIWVLREKLHDTQHEKVIISVCYKDLKTYWFILANLPENLQKAYGLWFGTDNDGIIRSILDCQVYDEDETEIPRGKALVWCVDEENHEVGIWLEKDGKGGYMQVPYEKASNG